MNQATFIGNLIAQAVQKQSQGGTCFITFSIAVNRKYKDKEETLYIECIKNGDNANLLPYLQKGKKIAVSGRVNCHAYLDKNNQPRASLDLAVFELELLSSSDSSSDQTQTSHTQQSPQNPFPTNTSNDGLPF